MVEVFDSLGNFEMIDSILKSEFNMDVKRKRESSILDGKRYEGYKQHLIFAWVAGLVTFAFFMMIGLQIIFLKKDRMGLNKRRKEGRTSSGKLEYSK